MDGTQHQHEMPVATKTRGGYTRQRQGCLTCRKRKKKCDQTYPICGHCSRLNLICQREAPRAVAIGPAQPPAVVSPAAQPAGNDVAKLYASLSLESIVFDDACKADIRASQRAMLRYYTSCFAIMLSTNMDNNCFLSVLLPMAFECRALMKALVAWSSMHLALRDNSFEDTALLHRGFALSSLKAAMEGGDISREMCLALTMVFCSMETIADGSSPAWYHHLAGGAAVLGANALVGSVEVPAPSWSLIMPSFEGGWLLRNFAYHDIMMSVSLDRRPLLTGEYWIDDIDDEHQKPDPYFGVAARILYLVAQTSHLSADFAETRGKIAPATPGTAVPARSLTRLHTQVQANSILVQRSTDSSVPTDFSSRARAIEAELMAWKCPTAQLGSTLEQLAEGYRSGALLHLYRTLRRYLTGYDGVIQGKIRHNVKAICKIAQELPQGCLAEAAVLFPLFIAGGEADETEDIEVIRERLQAIKDWRYLRNVGTCIDILDELWRLRASRTRNQDLAPADWLDVVKAHGCTLTIS